VLAGCKIIEKRRVRRALINRSIRIKTNGILLRTSKLEQIIRNMPIYMDIHQVPGIEAIDAAKAHQMDMKIQHEYHCKCMTYWIDEPRGVVFCLIEGPDKAVVEEMHKNSHGLIPNKIIEVSDELVESFLGRIHDPVDAVVSEDGLSVFSDSAFRILLVTEITDPVLLRKELGNEKANELLNRQNAVIRKELSLHDGREVEYAGSGFIASFSSAGKALSCALEIQKNLPKTDRRMTGFKMTVHGGEPVTNSDKLFGDAILAARRLCATSRHDKIIITSIMRDLLARDYFQMDQNKIVVSLPQDESMIESLFNTLEINWQDAEFTAAQFCSHMAMSKSQLYRKTIALWGLPPNQLLKDFRLDKARELLKKHNSNVAQATFDSGFTSPSYFTKCFKKKFGLLPANYLQSLQ
jgi:AraC-like DNA-binding protein